MRSRHHPEGHSGRRTGLLRAAVLGANDGIVSTASLIVGVAAASTTRDAVVIAAVAGMVSGAISMAAGEYVSVSSQADAEKADLERERLELETDIESERRELASIYVRRGLQPELAMQVAEQLMERDALRAHARDELGHSEVHAAQPVHAAIISAVTFATGAALPLAGVLVSTKQTVIPIVAASCLIALACTGALAARAGGASMLKGSARVTFWGMLGMAVTAAVGSLFGVIF